MVFTEIIVLGAVAKGKDIPFLAPIIRPIRKVGQEIGSRLQSNAKELVKWF